MMVHGGVSMCSAVDNVDILLYVFASLGILKVPQGDPANV